MSYCTRCGTALTGAFCGACGAPAPSTEPGVAASPPTDPAHDDTMVIPPDPWAANQSASGYPTDPYPGAPSYATDPHQPTPYPGDPYGSTPYASSSYAGSSYAAATYGETPGANPKRGWLPWLVVPFVAVVALGAVGLLALQLGWIPGGTVTGGTAPTASAVAPPSVDPSPTAKPRATRSAAAPSASVAPTKPTATVPVEPTETVISIPPGEDYPVVRVAAGQECVREGTGPFAAAGTANSTTSCPFAINVRTAYLATLNGADGTVEAYSPTTDRWYTMSCRGSQPVVCTGGRAGRVIIYGGELRVG